MRNTWLIIWREYYTRVRKRSFILLTIFGPLFFTGIMVLPILLMQVNLEEHHILVKDDSGMITALPDTTGIYFTLDKSEKNADDLRKDFEADELYDAFLYIPVLNPEKPRGIQLLSKEHLGLSTSMYIEQVLADKMEKINLANLDLTKEEVLQIRPSITLDDRLINAEDGDQQAHTLASTGIAYFMGFLTYIVLLIYGSMVMRGVMEEKNNRIVEVMISTVKPFQLMLGKIIGIGAVGLTQFSIWGILLTIIQLVLVVFIGDAFQAMPGSTGQETQQVDMQQMAQMVEGFATIDFGYLGMVFLVFFLGGYFLYASLFAAIGSLVSDDDSGEVQMYSFPLTMLILISIFIATAVIQQPNSSLAFWASIIPFSSPIVMPALIPFGIPAWHLALSITLLITGFICTAWLAGRVYRTGILMYGKKIRFREILRWVIHRS